MTDVLHVVSGDLYAGAERIVEELAIAQHARLGQSVCVAVFNEGLLESRLRAAGVETRVFDERSNGAASLVRKLRALVREKAPSVVNTHRFKENVLGGFSAARLTPSVRTVHGAPEFSRARNLRDRIIDGLDRFAARRLQSAVVCVSDELAQRLQPWHDARLEVVTNGIDGDRLRAAAAAGTPELAGDLRIGMFARLVPVKRIDMALEVVARARASSGLPMVLHVFGDGPLESQLRARAAGRDDVVFHGSTDVAPRYLRQMHALLMTSSHEGLPVSVLEAMALSVPVVATHTGGIPEVLGQGACGWLADGSDVAAYERGLIEALSSSAERERRVSAALHRVETVYSARHMAEAYREVYKMAIRQFTGQGPT